MSAAGLLGPNLVGPRFKGTPLKNSPQNESLFRLMVCACHAENENMADIMTFLGLGLLYFL